MAGLEDDDALQQQAAGSRQQAAGSRQQAAGSKAHWGVVEARVVAVSS